MATASPLASYRRQAVGGSQPRGRSRARGCQSGEVCKQEGHETSAGCVTCACESETEGAEWRKMRRKVAWLLWMMTADLGLEWCSCQFEKCVCMCLRRGYQNDWMMVCSGLSLDHDPSLGPFPFQIFRT